MNLTSRELLHAGRRIEVTRREMLLLELLILHSGRVFTREEIIDRLWGRVEPKVIDVYVSTIRRKTAEAVIETIRGHGYRLGTPPDTGA
ncbi:winged helix-turn-helix domain-containing protein [Deinococcus ruber]|uniref:OmpR/PhoB-type domain-containing protein n=1 Tax=Deinococcus ruber TaxID=1848197 RepID=A0A918FF09_9DEIO|nr:winged helix-turn-helix domain-containing protein [Deinococcus ruber]GGR31763.1 hypothetical protein GCM10008957_47970 [Deinococcus ruber]